MQLKSGDQSSITKVRVCTQSKFGQLKSVQVQSSITKVRVCTEVIVKVQMVEVW